MRSHPNVIPASSFQARLIPAALAALALAACGGGSNDTAAVTDQAGDDSDSREVSTFYAPAYRIPEARLMDASAARGKDIFHATYRHLGAPSGQRAANGSPYVGNKLACSNCHLEDGTRPFAVPLVVAALEYANPQYSPREGQYRDLNHHDRRTLP